MLQDLQDGFRCFFVEDVAHAAQRRPPAPEKDANKPWKWTKHTFVKVEKRHPYQVTVTVVTHSYAHKNTIWNSDKLWSSLVTLDLKKPVHNFFRKTSTEAAALTQRRHASQGLHDQMPNPWGHLDYSIACQQLRKYWTKKHHATWLSFKKTIRTTETLCFLFFLSWDVETPPFADQNPFQKGKPCTEGQLRLQVIHV